MIKNQMEKENIFEQQFSKLEKKEKNVNICFQNKAPKKGNRICKNARF
jgi:hypothetical protein